MRQEIGSSSSQVFWTRFEFRGIGLGFHLSQQPVEIEPPSEHRHAPLWRSGPLLLRAVPIQLQAVVVRVTQVDGFADAVITGSVQRDTLRR